MIFFLVGRESLERERERESLERERERLLPSFSLFACFSSICFSSCRCFSTLRAFSTFVNDDFFFCFYFYHAREVFKQSLQIQSQKNELISCSAAPAPAPPDSPLPIFPSPQPQTSERHPRSISVTKKTSAADATCFSVLPCGRASTLGLASAMPETATRAKPAVEKSLEERVAGAAALAAVELLMFFFFGEEAEEGWKEREKQGREGRRRRRRRRRRRQIRTLPTHPKPDAFRLIECIFAFDSNAAR